MADDEQDEVSPELRAALEARETPPVFSEWAVGFPSREAEPDPLATVVVQYPIHEEREMPGAPGRSMRFLKYRPGDRITPEEAQRLGLLPVQSEAPPAQEVK